MSIINSVQIMATFPVGNVVYAFRDGVYSWRYGRVIEHCTNSHGEYCALRVEFFDKVTIEYPFSTIFLDDWKGTFVRTTTKDRVCAARYRIGMKVMIKTVNGTKWEIGKITHLVYNQNEHRLDAIVVHIPGEDVTFVVDGFNDDGLHDRLRILKGRWA